MNIIIKTAKYELSPESEAMVKEKLVAIEKLLGGEAATALLEVEVTEAPAEGRSAEPYRLVARLTTNGRVYHAEAVKPSPESAADRVREDLSAEIRHERGRAKTLWKRGRAAVKNMLRFGR